MIEMQYPSKLMLFGEYAVIAGGEGLAIPWPDFFAEWVEQPETASAYRPHLERFAKWLYEQGFDSILDTDTFLQELEDGLDMHLNIPIGYGVGSSGAVVAAVYDRYAKEKLPISDLIALRNTLASMENFFHATSSGLDPLVCYVQQPIHITPYAINVVSTPISFGNLQMRLLDCGFARATHPLVSAFKEKLSDPHFHTALQEYIQLSNACIEHVLSWHETKFEQALRKLSAWQFHNFDFAIPEHLRKEWQDAVLSGNCFYKLCGAGGGGFMLVFS